MWLSKFLDLKEDVKGLTEDIKDAIFKDLKKERLTPLEFTILENVFNAEKITGYDLIQRLNDQFAGTWEAKSGTIYPILSKLKKNGFLAQKTVKSPIGPLKKVYFLTESGEKILKAKVGYNFLDQVQFVENFLVELATIYVKTFPKDKQKSKLREVRELLKDAMESVIKRIPLTTESKCPNCGAHIEKKHAAFCSLCGAELSSQTVSEEVEMEGP